MGEDRLRWNDIEIFCLLAEFGSIRQAAQHSDQSIETIRRRINAFELSVGERLFRRTAHGLAITEAGEEILANAKRARDAVLAISRRAGADRGSRPRSVRLSLPEDLGALWLLPALQWTQDQAPNCVLHNELRFPNDDPDWDKTDISLQFAKPENPDLICRKIGSLSYSLFCRRDDYDELNPAEFEKRIDDMALVLPGDRHHFVQRLYSDEYWRGRIAGASMRVDSASCALRMLSMMNAIAVFPILAAADAPWLFQLPESSAPIFETELWIAFHDDIRRSATAKAFLERLIQLVISNPDLSMREQAATRRIATSH